MKRFICALAFATLTPWTHADWIKARTLPAPEAHQAAAADANYVYAISSTKVAKYDRKSGKKIAQSTGKAKHLNSGFLWNGQLLCAHSNYPQKPEVSQIKTLNLTTMKLTTFKDFGNFGGSLTWVIRHENHWWCNFAHYGEENSKTFLVKFDDRWKEIARWAYPKALIRQLGRFSLSGGMWHDDTLMVTGHDDPVIFRLQIPKQGTVLKLLGTEKAPFTGQGIAVDPKGGLVGINRAKKQLVFARKRLNVLLILVDDLKPSFGVYGKKWVHSPNLDRLATRGMRFDRAYCNQAVCAPSRNTLLTGSRSTSLGVYSLGYHFRRAVPNAITMPQFFKKHGYHSAGIGKVFHIGHGNIDDKHSWSVPFHPDKVIDYVLRDSTGGKLTREEAYFSNQKLGQIRSLPRGAAWEKADVKDDAYADGRIANEAIRRLQKAKSTDKPFFLAVGFTKPHLPFCAPKKYWDLYDPKKLPMPKTHEYPKGAPRYAGKFKLGELNQYKPIPQNPPLKESMTRQLIHGYYAALSYMDAQLGRVLDALKKLELDDSTIIALWGDHGYHLGDHGAWTKHTNYEQANRIPILISAPGVTKAKSHSDALIESVDLYPTLAELAGLPKPKGPQRIDGASLVPILKGEKTSIRDHAYHCYPRRGRLGRAIRTARYRMVEWKPINAPVSKAEYELYDYQSDPLETRNLAKSKPKVLAEMKKILARHPEAKPRRR